MKNLESLLGEQSTATTLFSFHYAGKTQQTEKAKLDIEVNIIQGLYEGDAQDGEFYMLLAKVLLASFSERNQQRKEKE